MIPLSVPLLAGNELNYVKDCLDTGWISSAGSFVNQFEETVANFAGTKYGVACMNGTVGLHIAQIIADVKPGDYVIAPNITFIATLNAITYTGASPLLIDVMHDTWQMDLDLLEQFLRERTHLKYIDNQWYSYLKSDEKRISAIMPVHVLGNIGDMDRLCILAETYHLTIIEDSTEALGSYYKNKHAGSFGKLGVFSFNGNKIISTGGGGVIVTDDENLAKKAKHLTTQAKVSAIEYIHDDIGYNYRLVNVLAAIGVAQMEQLENILERKRKMDEFYKKTLAGIGDIEFQKANHHVNPNCWLFTFKTSKMRALLKYLNDCHIQSRPFWMPMNQLEMFKNNIYITSNNTSNEIYESCISIPSSAGITTNELEQVVTSIKAFYNQA